MKKPAFGPGRIIGDIDAGKPTGRQARRRGVEDVEIAAAITNPAGAKAAIDSSHTATTTPLRRAARRKPPITDGALN